jgi:FkbM family methyltransferase
MARAVKNFTTIESVYGNLIVNRHCAYQADVLIKTGFPHIQFELMKILTIINRLPEHCVVVDAGANIGLVAIPIAQAVAARGGTVLAFEVQRMLFYALCGSAALNDLANLHAFNLGLGSGVGQIHAPQIDYSHPQDFGEISLAHPNPGAPGEVVTIMSIDSLNLNRLDFLKIDVEGMEPDILRGARDSIAKYQPWCWVEYRQVGIEPIKANFPGQNYRFFPMDPLNMLCAPAEKLEHFAIDGCEV